MEIKNNLRSLVYEKGYRSLKKFSIDNDLSYFSLLNLANNESKTLDKQLLIDLCVKLDCEIGDLLHFSQKKYIPFLQNFILCNLVRDRFHKGFKNFLKVF